MVTSSSSVAAVLRSDPHAARIDPDGCLRLVAAVLRCGQLTAAPTRAHDTGVASVSCSYHLSRRSSFAGALRTTIGGDRDISRVRVGRVVAAARAEQEARGRSKREEDSSSLRNHAVATKQALFQRATWRFLRLEPAISGREDRALAQAGTQQETCLFEHAEHVHYDETRRKRSATSAVHPV
jgi:hypothetical protein